MYYVADNRSIQLVTTFWLPALFPYPMDFIIVKMRILNFFFFSFLFWSLKFSSFLIDLNAYDSDFGLKLMTLRNYSDYFPLIQMIDQISLNHMQAQVEIGMFLEFELKFETKSQPANR